MAAEDWTDKTRSTSPRASFRAIRATCVKFVYLGKISGIASSAIL